MTQNTEYYIIISYCTVTDSKSKENYLKLLKIKVQTVTDIPISLQDKVLQISWFIPPITSI